MYNFHTDSKKLQTCRYWALGPGCPNFDQHGVLNCEYAHFDAGSLASPLEQRGTCLQWSRCGNCPRGTACWYEHRHTGVTGLWQDMIDLVGLDLEIADAALQAGFNTRHHEALFNLIWAVKRTAIRILRPGNQSFKPHHPIYPDRYRPSGIGDNTVQKRRSMKRRWISNFESDPHRQQAHSRAADTDPLVNDSPRWNIDTAMDAESVKDDELSKRQKTRRAPSTEPDLLIFSPSPSPRVEDIPEPGLCVKTVLFVKAKLDEAQKEVHSCQVTMKKWYDEYGARFCDTNEIMVPLRNLSTHMEGMRQNARAGAKEMDSAIKWLQSNCGVSDVGVNHGDLLL